MKKSNTKPLSLYTFLSFVFIVTSIAVAAIKLTNIPPEYAMVTVVLLFGAVGTLQCLNMQKRDDKLKALKSVHKWAST